MKAWIVYDACGFVEGSVLVFAETRGKAINQALSDFEECAYTDLRAERAKKLDGLENSEPKDDYWNNDDIRLILVREYGWHCLEYDHTECDHCVAHNYCEVVAQGY